MDFIRIAIANIDGEAAEAVSEVFNQYGYGGAVIETIPPDLQRASVHTIIPATESDLLKKVELVLALMAKALPQGLPKPTTELVGANDWAESWKETFHVVHIGPRVVIQPSWREYTPMPNDVVVRLDPGLAFGSGLHPSTKLCLEILQTLSLTNVDFFDVGTGSGILSIAAAKMGANPVRAVDVEEVAVRVAQENFTLNDIPDVEAALGSANESGRRQWSLVIANILAHILIDIMADLKCALAPKGQLILSGILQDQEPAIREALTKHDLSMQQKRVDGDWIACIVTHKPNHR